jgi:hypothetical protein
MALWRLRTTVDDRPGFLAVLTASLALRSVNILSVQVHGTETGAVDDFLVDAPNELTEAELLAAVAKGRGRDTWVRRTEARHLVDPQTEVLAAATWVIRDPKQLPAALTSTLMSVTVQTIADTDDVRPGFTATRMQLRDPFGGLLLIERETPAFTPAEYARARALIDIAVESMRSSDRKRPVAPPAESDAA